MQIARVAGGLFGAIARKRLKAKSDHVLLHKTKAANWKDISFQLILIGEGNSDSVYYIGGSTNSGYENGKVIVKKIVEQMRTARFYYKQDVDGSISIYITSASGVSIKSTNIIKDHFDCNVGDEMIDLETLDVSTLKEIIPQ